MIEQIVQICIVPLLGILIKFLGDFLIAKKNELNTKTDSALAQKYIDLVYNTINDCVIATNQTYVNSLKDSGSFDKAAQEEAFNRTMTAILAVLSEDAKTYIQETTGDLNTYLTTLIETCVNKNRQ